MVLWGELCSPTNPYVKTLIPSTLECDLIGRQAVHRDNQVKMRSLGWALISRPDFSGGSDGKASVYNAGDLGSIPGSGRSTGEGNGNLLQYYCLENPMNRRAW